MSSSNNREFVTPDNQNNINDDECTRATSTQQSLEFNNILQSNSLAIQREKRKLRQRERRANMSDEQRAIANSKHAEYMRKRRADVKLTDSENYENHLARRREYQRKRYALMKDAETRLQNDIVPEGEDVNIEQLQNLALKRRKLIDASIRNRRNNKRAKWVPILQIWDEDHPCQ